MTTETQLGKRIFFPRQALTSNYLRDDVEVELRFGDFGKGGFQSSVSSFDFSRLMTYLRDTIGNPVVSEIETEYYSDNVRKVNGRLEMKKRLSVVDMRSYGIRLAFSSEIPTKKLPTDTPKIETKTRYTWYICDGQIRIDLSNGIRREVEVEIVKNPKEMIYVLSLVADQLLRVIRDTPLLLEKPRIKNIVRDLNKLLFRGENHSPRLQVMDLPQARNIKARDIRYGALLPKDGGVIYSMTIKADGVRRLMYFSSHGVAFVSYPHEVRILSSSCPENLMNTVLEGEYIHNDGSDRDVGEKPIFLAFDCLYLRGKNWRGRPHYQRLQACEEIIEEISPIDTIDLRVKEFFSIRTPDSLFENARAIRSQKYDFDTDGIIFMPSSIGYPRNVSKPVWKRDLEEDPEILKWKPPEQLTIDFRVSDDGSSLLMSDGTVFKGSRMNPWNGEFSDPLASGQVAEYRYLKEQNTFERVRFRPDKISGNRNEVAIDVWDDIMQPITEDVLLGQKFGLLQRYHNRVKTSMFESVRGAKTLISIGAGRGGDVRKWKKAGIKKILCIEPNEEHIEVLKSRLEGAGYTGEFYNILNIYGQDWKEIVRVCRSMFDGGQVDVVAYMLSFTFFFGENPVNPNENSLISVYKILQRCLIPGGKFILLSMDGDAVLELLEQSPKPFSQIDMHLLPDKRLYINIPDSIVTEQVEYLTNIEGFLQQLIKGPFRIVKNEMVSDEKLLNPEELQFTSLFRQVIVEKEVTNVGSGLAYDKRVYGLILKLRSTLDGTIPRTVSEIRGRLPWCANIRRKYVPDNVQHNGQLKLVESEIRFMTKIAKENPEKRMFIIYIGAAPSNKQMALMRMFPEATFLLWDPNPFNIRTGGFVPYGFEYQGGISPEYTPEEYYPKVRSRDFWKKIMTNPDYQTTIFNGFFDFDALEAMEEVMVPYIPDDVIFAYITDIRTALFVDRLPTDADIIGNHILQSAFHKLLNPRYSLMKTRVAFHEKYSTRDDIYKVVSATLNTDIEKKFRENKKKYNDFEKIIDAYERKKLAYYEGEFNLQAYPPNVSSETRLETSSKKLVEIDEKEYEERMFYYNILIRSYEYGQNPLLRQVPGMDRSADAIQLATTIVEYCQSRNVQDMKGVLKMVIGYARPVMVNNSVGHRF